MGHLLLHQECFHHEAMWKKQLHCISQKILLTAGDSDGTVIYGKGFSGSLIIIGVTVLFCLPPISFIGRQCLF